jgi:hypothetical protein
MSSTTIIGVCLCFRGCVRLQDDFTATSAQDKIGLLLPSGRADTGVVLIGVRTMISLPCRSLACDVHLQC